MNEKLKKEIKKYCELNNIDDVEGFTENMLQQGFNVEKYGMGPIEKWEPKVVEKEVPVEKIVEVIKEVPVEKIVEVEKEVEVIKEVPVEKIVEVEKEVYITDDEQVNDLKEKLIQSQKDASKYLAGWEDKLQQLEILTKERDELKKSVEQLEKITSHNEMLSESETIQKLESKIKNLETELELEKNRSAKRKKNEKPKHRERKPGLGNIINWVSKDEREGDVWGED
jgi:hypothetical protein